MLHAEHNFERTALPHSQLSGLPQGLRPGGRHQSPPLSLWGEKTGLGRNSWFMFCIISQGKERKFELSAPLTHMMCRLMLLYRFVFGLLYSWKFGGEPVCGTSLT